nr:UBAP1-MVB12-associated (UMA)-domain containing protein 1 isoform X2 [Vicugna pacos]
MLVCRSGGAVQRSEHSASPRRKPAAERRYSTRTKSGSKRQNFRRRRQPAFGVHIFQLQSSHFSKNTWNRLQKRVTAGWLPLLHLYIFSWSSEKRKSGEHFFFFKERWEKQEAQAGGNTEGKRKKRKGEQILKQNS